jgi:hypothetical protein
MESTTHQTLAQDFFTRSPPTALQRPFWMQLTRQQIEESEQAWPGFNESLRACALAAVDRDEPDLIRRALQCLAFVGRTEDVPHLQKFLNHPVAQVAHDARTCIFEIHDRLGVPRVAEQGN